MPAARIARCSPAVPLETADTCVDAEPARERLPRTRPAAGPSASRPRAQRLEHQLLLARADQRAGQRDHVGSRGAARARVRSRAAGQHARLERVDERLPARLDDVLGHADRAPGVACRRWRRAARA